MLSKAIAGNGLPVPQTLATYHATHKHAAWVAFATSGDPGWSQYDLK